VLIVRALTAVLKADSKSALGITINASLPPSSSTLFLISRAGRARERRSSFFAACYSYGLTRRSTISFST
jgi:hypothetical protein